ncbi:hypothetical protein [Streptosporangium sp. CA-115845]|uniref:hypothetical protein n=1 Tax=Streptosporangium sp. CA-115845 TaxID=3240071 RepID=UPI003D91EBA5
MIRQAAAITVLSLVVAGCSGSTAESRRRAPGHSTPAGDGLALSSGVWEQLGGGGAGMTKVVVTGPGEAWAVGADGEGGGQGRGVLRWDGRAWRSARPPDGLLYPRALSGTSPDNVWLFDKDADAWRWDGRRWTRRERPPWPRSADVHDAVVTGPAEVWVAGKQNVGTRSRPSWRPLPLARWSPSGWSEVSAPSPSIWRLSAATPDDVWAIATDDSDSFTVIEHWDGRRWTISPTPSSFSGAKVQFYDIAARSSREVWVAGTVVRPGHRVAALLMRWDGSRWNLADGIPSGAVSFGAVAPDGRGGVWLGATNYSYDDDRILLHFDGRSWTYEKSPESRNAPAVSDMARVPGGDQVIAVGGNPSYDEDGSGWIWVRR